MIENKKGLTQKEIDDFYKQAPEHMEVLETKELNTEMLRYYTVRLEYIY